MCCDSPLWKFAIRAFAVDPALAHLREFFELRRPGELDRQEEHEETDCLDKETDADHKRLHTFSRQIRHGEHRQRQCEQRCDGDSPNEGCDEGVENSTPPLVHLSSQKVDK